jgi:hypothetical protein
MATWTSTFDGDENPLSESGDWTSGPSGWDAVKKLSGVAMAVNTSSNSAGRYEGNSLDSDQSSEVTTVNFSSGGTSLGGCLTRMQGITSGTTDCYVFDADFWNDIVRLFRVDDTAGSLAWTQLGSDASIPSSAGGDVFKIKSVSSTHTGWQNGTERISRTDSTYTGGQPGIFFYVTTLTHVDYTSWSGTDEVPITEGFVGSTMAAGTGAVTATIHADAVTDDILVLTIEGEGEDANADSPPTGGDWTAIDGSTGSVASSEAGQADRTRNSTYYHVYDSASPPNLSVPDAGQHTIAVISVWRGYDTSSPLDATSVSSSNATNSTAGSATGTSTSSANSRVITICTHGDECTISSPVNASLTGLAIDGQHSSPAGSDGAVGIISGIKASAGATGTTTWTISASEEQANWCFAFKLASGAAALTISIDDDVAVAENLTVSLSELFASIFDSVDVSEDITSLLNPLLIDIYDSVEASETLSEFFDKLSMSIEDLIEVAEQITALIPTHKVNIADSVDVSENIAIFLNELNININDDIEVSEFLSLVLTTLNPEVSDSVDVSESLTVAEDPPPGADEINRSVVDSATVAEAITIFLHALYVDISDTIETSENLTASLSELFPNVFDNIETSEDLTVLLPELFPNIFSSIEVSENLTVVRSEEAPVPSISDSMTVQEVVTIYLDTLNKIISDAIVLSESVTVYLSALNKSIFDAIAVSENIRINMSPARAQGVIVRIRARDRTFTVSRRGTIN